VRVLPHFERYGLISRLKQNLRSDQVLIGLGGETEQRDKHT
jgi:hypothetical protein